MSRRRPRAFAFDSMEPRVSLSYIYGLPADVAGPAVAQLDDPAPIEDEPGDFANGNPPGAFLSPAPIGPAGPAF